MSREMPKDDPQRTDWEKTKQTGEPWKGIGNRTGT
jgi:hypothetical protein